MVKKKCIVVGGGIAGLTAAVYLAKSGKETLLLEKNEECGGMMNSFTREGFHFEGGARALVNSGLLAPMARELGLDLPLLPNPVSLGIEDEIFTVAGEESLEDYSGLLKRLYPGAVDEVEALIREIRDVVADLKILYGVDNPLFSKNSRGPRMIPAVAAWLPRFLHTIRRIGILGVPMEAYLGKLVRDRSLLDVFSQHFFRGTPAFFTLSYFALYGDYLYPAGGVGEFPRRIREKIGEFGGEVVTGAEVTRVLPGQGILEDANGNRYGYDKLVWTADLKALYSMVDPEGLPRSVRGGFARERESILSSKGAESVFTVFLAVDVPRERLAGICSGHLFYTPSRRGLGDTCKARLRSLLNDAGGLSRERVFAWLEDFCDLNTFEISIPVLRDPAMAPEGKAGIIVSCLMDYELCERIERAGWFGDFSAAMEDRITRLLARTIFPFLGDKLIFRFSASPLTLRRRTGSSGGSIVGWSFEGEIPVVSSMLKMGSSVRTSIPRVFKAGKWAFSPAGGPTAIMTGRLAAKAAGR